MLNQIWFFAAKAVDGYNLSNDVFWGETNDIHRDSRPVYFREPLAKFSSRSPADNERFDGFPLRPAFMNKATEIRHRLDPIPFHIDRERLFRLLYVKEGKSCTNRLIELANMAEEIARPKATYRLCRLEKQTVDAVIVAGVKLSSRVLRVNMDPVHRVFVGITTCGVEMLDLMEAATDFLEKYWVDVMMEMALRAADQAMEAHIRSTYQPAPLSSMCPGAIEDWPITEQRPLFDIIGKEAEGIGVTLSNCMLMKPMKSLSRVLFPSETGFQSCRLCPIQNCPSRRAIYDPDLMASRYSDRSENSPKS